MKKVFFSFGLLLTVGLAITVFNSCKEKDDDGKTPAIQVKNQNDLTQTVYADAGKGNDILITTTGAWSSEIKTQDTPAASLLRQLRSTPTWITISPDHGDKASDYTITVSLTTNTTGADRTAVIVIQCNENEITITVTQKSVTADGNVPGNSNNQNNQSDSTKISDDINGVVINGVRWATRNVDAPGTFAAKPEDAGMFYQWNSNVGWSTTEPLINSNGGTDWYYINPYGDSWEKANDPSPAGWRVPTYEEQLKLYSDKVTCENTTLKGINGMKYTDKATGASIFLPAAGRRSGGVIFAGLHGYYWSSTVYDDTSEYGTHYLYFNNGSYSEMYGLKRGHGLSVRAVADN